MSSSNVGIMYDLMRDARRYRWLKDNAIQIDAPKWRFDQECAGNLPKDLDAWVDAEIGDNLKLYIFFRKEGFYPIELKDDDDVVANVKRNPGTIRVEDVDGRIVWEI